MENSSQTTISTYLLQRLQQLGVRHIFGVPGDYTLDLLDQVIKSPLEWVGNCNELNAGYAADGYARVHGLGAAMVTYGVGGFSILNAVAGAYAEQVPLLVISGAPHSMRRKANAMVHHLTSNYQLQLETFQKMTIDAAMLTEAETAPGVIDRVLNNCMQSKRPAYIEIPLDMVNAPCSALKPMEIVPAWATDSSILEECVNHAAERINEAKNPVVLIGVEVPRFSHAHAAMRLVERIELPYASMVNSKSALPELHPQFIGIYQGSMSQDYVREQVESSDCVLALGVWMTDFDTGGFSAKIDDNKIIRANNECVIIGAAGSYRLWLSDFIPALTKALRPRSFLLSHPSRPVEPPQRFTAQANTKLTVRRFYQRLDSFLDDNMILMPEPGDAFCAAPYLHIEEADNFLVQAYYASIGYALPAALGVSLAKPDKRAVVLEGDGAFQMTAQELSTLMRYECAPIVFLFNNNGYMIERILHEDGPYNDIQNWKYHQLPAVFGEHALSFDVRTEEELEESLAAAKRESKRLVFIEIHFSKLDCSDALASFGEKFRRLATRTTDTRR